MWVFFLGATIGNAQAFTPGLILIVLMKSYGVLGIESGHIQGKYLNPVFSLNHETTIWLVCLAPAVSPFYDWG